MKNQNGFTLIEVMIVVVIVAILAAIAIPSYQDSIRKTRRADAKEAGRVLHYQYLYDTWGRPWMWRRPLFSCSSESAGRQCPSE
jgi:prepilin-type N-terminal cleavage/methylation domain-containing protein